MTILGSNPKNTDKLVHISLGGFVYPLVLWLSPQYFFGSFRRSNDPQLLTIGTNFGVHSTTDHLLKSGRVQSPTWPWKKLKSLGASF